MHMITCAVHVTAKFLFRFVTVPLSCVAVWLLLSYGFTMCYALHASGHLAVNNTLGIVLRPSEGPA